MVRSGGPPPPLPAAPRPPPSSSPLPPAAEGREAGRGQGPCTWCPRGEATGRAPEVGLGDPGPCVPAPASWLRRGRKLGRFSGGPRPAAPPRFLPAPRARPAPPLPSPSCLSPGPSCPRWVWTRRPQPRPGPARLLPALSVCQSAGRAPHVSRPCQVSAIASPCFPSGSLSPSFLYARLAVRVSFGAPLCHSLSPFSVGVFSSPGAPASPRCPSSVSLLLQSPSLTPSGSLYLSASAPQSSPQLLLSLESGGPPPCPFFYGPFCPFSLSLLSLCPSISASPGVPVPSSFFFSLALSPSLSLCLSLSLLSQKPCVPRPLSFSPGAHYRPQVRPTDSKSPCLESTPREQVWPGCGQNPNLAPAPRDRPLCL